jgi:hypothetical protein
MIFHADYCLAGLTGNQYAWTPSASTFWINAYTVMMADDSEMVDYSKGFHPCERQLR